MKNYIDHSENHRRHKKISIGLFGFGVAGKGLYELLLQHPELNVSIKKICIRSASKSRNIFADFTTNANELLEDDNIDVIVELIDDADAAFNIVSAALRKRKPVVSANKKMIAEHAAELIMLQQVFQTPFLYEASCCAGIPIIRNLETYFNTDLLKSIAGIVNGSTNFILSRMAQENLSYENSLALAQHLGFAESDPSLDVSGQDAANKLSILLLHAFGRIQKPTSTLINGIESLTSQDHIYAAEHGMKIKLIAEAKRLSSGKIATCVLPRFIPESNELFYVNDEFNGLIVESHSGDQQFFKGKGAGAIPTASAVLADIISIKQDYHYPYKSLQQTEENILTHDYLLKVIIGTGDASLIDYSPFETIETCHQQENYLFVTGIIHATKLLSNHWWKAPGISLMLPGDPIIETGSREQVPVKNKKLAFA